MSFKAYFDCNINISICMEKTSIDASLSKEKKKIYLFVKSKPLNDLNSK
jgi:hypothetical protein